MKTDRFTDIIRRKLESIRPDFTEKDWARMQATLQQATPPSPDSLVTGPSVVRHGWLSQPWMMAAAAVSTVVLVTVSVWQRQQINDLRHTVRQLNQQTVAKASATKTADSSSLARTDATASASVNESVTSPAENSRPGAAMPSVAQSSQPAPEPVAARPDTVYITKYVPVPAKSRLAEADRPTRRVGAPAERPEPTTQLAQENTQPQAARPSDAPVDRAVPSTSGSEPPTNRVQTPANEPTRLAAIDKATRQKGSLATDPRNRRVDSDHYEPVPPSGSPASPASVNQPSDAGSSVTHTGVSEGTGQPTAQYELMASRPAQFSSIDWSTALSRRTNRAKPVRTVTVGGQAAPVSQPVRQVATRLRLGAGTDVSTKQWSLGAFTELIVGNHWQLNLGLSQASHINETFDTDIIYFIRTRQNFRKEYARDIPPAHDIFGIGLRSKCIQLPINIAYRIPVTQHLTLLPAIGTNLNLYSSDLVTFYSRSPFFGGGYETVSKRFARPVDTFTNLTFGTSLEWQQHHWVAQAGPVLTAPLQTDAKWQTTLSASLRARVFYQF